jgi:hypothetical protein
MEFGQVITRSAMIVWRHRYLWLLALLGGADAGPGGSFNYSTRSSTPTPTGPGASPSGSPFAPGSVATSPADTGAAARQVAQWLADNIGLVIALGVLAVVLVAAFLLLSCVTTGALVRGSAEHDADRPFRLGLAWRAGLQTFWSILGLRLLSVLVSLVALALLLVVVIGTIGFLASNPGGGSIAVVVFADLQVAGAVFVALLAFGIVLVLATRSVVLERRGPVGALGRGLQLLGTRTGRTLLAWLIQIGLGIGVGIVVGIPVLIGVAIVASAVPSGAGAALAVGIPVGLLLLVVLVGLGAVVGAYFSTFWTLVFRRLEYDPPRPGTPAS